MSVFEAARRRSSAARVGVVALVCAGAMGLAVGFAAQMSFANQKDGDKKEEKVDEPKAKPAAEAGGEDFDKLYGQLKEIITDLNNLKAKYGQAKDADRPAIEEEYREKTAAGQAIFPKLLPAAEKAFAAKPDMTTDAAKHLFESAQRGMAEGNSKEATRILKVMMAKVPDNAELLALAGTIAFNSGDDKAAAEHLKKASQAGALTSEATKVLEELKIREKEAKANDLPRVKLETSKGDIVIELFENEAPNSVANFISLIEKKFYDGLTFHRVIDGFMAQGGDPTGDGSGGPGYAIACECYSKDHRNHFRGTLSMAHAGKDTGGSQFFLCFTQTTHLDGKHTAFGRIIEGMDVLDKLKRIQPGEPGTPDKIVKATVVRKRDHKYEPKTLPNPRG